jgi:hypothetical protein
VRTTCSDWLLQCRSTLTGRGLAERVRVGTLAASSRWTPVGPVQSVCTRNPCTTAASALPPSRAALTTEPQSRPALSQATRRGAREGPAALSPLDGAPTVSHGCTPPIASARLKPPSTDDVPPVHAPEGRVVVGRVSRRGRRAVHLRRAGGPVCAFGSVQTVCCDGRVITSETSCARQAASAT